MFFNVIVFVQLNYLSMCYELFNLTHCCRIDCRIVSMKRVLICVRTLTNPLNKLAIIRFKTRKAFHTLLQAVGRASQ